MYFDARKLRRRWQGGEESSQQRLNVLGVKE